MDTGLGSCRSYSSPSQARGTWLWIPQCTLQGDAWLAEEEALPLLAAVLQRAKEVG